MILKYDILGNMSKLASLQVDTEVLKPSVTMTYLYTLWGVFCAVP